MSNAKLRLLYTSNAFWSASGYGVQGRSLLTRLAELPEFGGEPGSVAGRRNIANFAWYGLQGGIHEVDGFRCYPSGTDAYGNDIIGAHTKDFGANLVVSLIDVWVLQHTAQKVRPAFFCPWFPIDHDPVPQAVLNALAGAYRPLTYSKWGCALLKKQGIHNTYIPHGIEPSVYKILPRDAALLNFKRQMTGRPDSHLTVMVAANKGFPDRKGFQFQIRAWAEFARDKPHAFLYLHTEPGLRFGGMDLYAFFEALAINEGRVILPDPYRYLMGYPPEYLNTVYNCADVLLSASRSEGFGIPIIEAQAAGCPVIVNNFSAMPELVRWGQAVEPLDIEWTPMNAFQTIPDARGIQDALEGLHARWLDNERGAGERWQVSRANTSAAIHAEYNWDTIVRDQWRPLIADLAEAAPALPERPGLQQVALPPQAPIQTPPPPPQPEPNGLHKLGVTVEDRRMPVRRVAPLAKEETP